MAQLKTLTIADNVSEAVQVRGNNLVFRVETTEASTITVQTSIDGKTFEEVPDVDFAVDGSFQQNLTDFVPGQFVKIASTGEMTTCKVLAE